MNERRKYTPRILLAFTSLVVALLVAELALRVTAYRSDRKQDAAWKALGETRRLAERAEVGLGQAIRLSDNPRVVYELIPEMDVIFRGRRLRTDANGFRRMVSGTRQGANLVRLVGLGDSFMFGWDVEDHEAYMTLLATRLNRRYPQCQWDVINTAVPGYNTVMQVEAFKDKAATLAPDAVLVHFVINDLDLPNFIVTRSDVFSLRRSFLRDAFSKSFRFRFSGLDRLERLPPDLRNRGAGSADEVPEAYRDMVGVGAYEQAMRDLHALSEDGTFEVFVLCDLSAPSYVRAICDELGFELIETDKAVRQHLEALGLRDVLDSDLVQSPEDTHPSPAGHRLISDLLLKTWETSGWLEATCEANQKLNHE